MNVKQSTNLLKMLSGMYPNASRLSEPETIKGYAVALAEVDYAAALEAMPDVLAAHPTFPPTAPELRAALPVTGMALDAGRRFSVEVSERAYGESVEDKVDRYTRWAEIGIITAEYRDLRIAEVTGERL